MDEETPSKNKRVIKLSIDEYSELERLMQWPEDLPKWDAIRKPTNMSEFTLESFLE